MRDQRAMGTRRQGPSGGERVETVIVGGGQAGLAVGYHLARRDRPFVILDGDQRAGDAWRRRWDSLRLFTPARYSGLPGWPFPAPLSPTRPGTRSSTTWRPMPPGSTCPCATASAWTGSPGTVAGSW
jgi:cation diffusion facilitator CzcD-associated flavoprotein CzcO